MIKYIALSMIFMLTACGDQDTNTKPNALLTNPAPSQTEVSSTHKSWSAAKKATLEVWDGFDEHYGGCEISKGKVLSYTCDYSLPINVQGNYDPTKIAIEHIFPTSWYRNTVACGIYGTDREKCNEDSGYKLFETDLNNLMPTIAGLNLVKSDDPFCDEVKPGEKIKDFGNGFIAVTSRVTVTPKGETKGCIIPPSQYKGSLARTQLYMAMTYNISLPSEYEAMLKDWHNRYPVTSEELGRRERIKEHLNPINPLIK